MATYHDLSFHLSPKAAVLPPAEPERAYGLIGQARTLANDHQYLEAGVVLKNPHEEIFTALNNLMKSGSLMYDLRSKSSAAKFDHDMARLLRYEELIPADYAELQPDEDSIRLSERYVRKRSKLRGLAKRQAGKGGVKSASSTLLEALKHL